MRKYIIKWLHLEAEVKQLIIKLHIYIELFNQLLILGYILYRSNFNVTGLAKPWDIITVSSEQPPKLVSIPISTKFLHERGRFDHIWNQFKVLTGNELDKNVMITGNFDREGGGKSERVYWKEQNWKDFDDKKKLLHAVLWIIYKKVTQRIQILWGRERR
jgi:hypothetical protein